MSTGMPVDPAVLLAAVLLVVGVLASAVAARYRVPALLLFVGIGMAVADDGLELVRFADARLAQNVAAVALAVILFEGGLTTRPEALRRAGAPALLLATVGVVLTAAVVALAAALLLGLDATTAALVGAVVSSTDAAAVFGALRGEALPRRLRDVLQLESGLNDPVAIMLTVGVVETWRADPSAGEWVAFGVLQLAGGMAVGALLGTATRWLLERLRLPGVTSSATLALGAGGVAYGLAAAVGASGFLAVFVTGLLLARSPRLARPLRTFHESLATIAQAVLFLLLGLLVFPSSLVGEIGPALVITAVLAFVARPLAVAVCLPWFGVRRAELVVVAWAGLRGAVPVVLATIPLTAGYPDGSLVFDIIFVTVLLSVAAQGPTVGPLIHRMRLAADDPVAVAEIVPIDSIEADAVELRLAEGARVLHRPLRAVPLPGRARIGLVTRRGRPFVPDGDTVLQAGDLLLVVVPPGDPADALVGWADPPAPTSPPRPEDGDIWTPPWADPPGAGSDRH